jgi:Tol biopolymer transport system component/DNA-binding winged helix-turn-helix (wHTH) protein
MPSEQFSSSVISFGPFQVDLRTQELKKHGAKVRLPGQSFQILAMLLQNPGELVTREELQHALWPADTHVDFERGVNAAVNRLREVLGDSADDPRLIETLPRRGYRFIGTITPLPSPEVVPDRSNASAENSASLMTPAINSGPHPAAKRLIAPRILLSLICAIALIFLCRNLISHPELSAVNAVPITDYPGMEFCPAISPDGSRIAFAWADPGKESKGVDLYVKGIHSENLVRLTQHPADVVWPAWSPDSTQIAFIRMSRDDPGIYVVPALGGSERKLRAIKGWWNVSWSADGKWIAYMDLPGSAERPRLYLLSLDTLESRQIPHAESCLEEWQPASDNSGDLLAYACLLKANDNEVGIYTVRLSGGSPRLITRLTTGFDITFGMAWTSDDRKLIVARPHVGDDFELNELTLADGSLRTLPLGQGTLSPTISATGDRLAYAHFSAHVDIWRKNLLHPEMPATKLISSTYDQSSPQYSPDGNHVAFSSNRTGSTEIWISDIDGMNLVQMSDRKSSKAGSARWSPDSQKLTFDSRQSGHTEVYVVDISERLPRKLATNLQEMSTPSWSRDGKWIYFESTSDQRIFRCPAGGGNAEALTAESGSFALESYEGGTVYFYRSASGGKLRMVPLNQIGATFEVPGMPPVHDQSHYTVVPGGIYFVPTDAPKSISYFDFSTRQVRKVFGTDQEHNNGLSVSPDGQWILYTQIGQQNADIMLVDHFK